jgi:uncharacterized membrane protein YdbT with pleckstrin-like domain
MSYVKKNLLPGETVTCTGKLHWIIYLKSMLVVAFGVLILLASFFERDQVPAKLWIWGAVAVVVGAVAALPPLLHAWSTELAVTTVRVIAKHGWIRRSAIEMLHMKIESMSVQQSIPGRILNYGTLVIHGTGGGVEAIPNIARPLEFRNAATAAQSEAWKH